MVTSDFTILPLMEVSVKSGEGQYGSYVLSPGRGENYGEGSLVVLLLAKRANKNVLIRRARSRIDQATLENEVGKEGMEPDDLLY